MADRGTPPERCHDGAIRSAIAGAARRLIDGNLSGGVRPWDLPGLQRRAAELGEVASARAVFVDGDVLVAELVPGGERLLLRGVEDTRGWSVSRTATQRPTPPARFWPNKSRPRFSTAPHPFRPMFGGVIIDGGRGILLTGHGDSALIIEG